MQCVLQGGGEGAVQCTLHDARWAARRWQRGGDIVHCNGGGGGTLLVHCTMHGGGGVVQWNGGGATLYNAPWRWWWWCSAMYTARCTMVVERG